MADQLITVEQKFNLYSFVETCSYSKIITNFFLFW